MYPIHTCILATNALCAGCETNNAYLVRDYRPTRFHQPIFCAFFGNRTVPAFPHEAAHVTPSGSLLEYRQASIQLTNILCFYTPPHVLEFQKLNLPTFWVAQKGHCQRNWHRGSKPRQYYAPYKAHWASRSRYLAKCSYRIQTFTNDV